MSRSKLVLRIATAALACTAGTAFAGYADERALIEDLQARYLFAFDWQDAQGYANTFAEDGVLDYGGGEIKGRKAIAAFIAEGAKRSAETRAKTPANERPRVGRHIISNITVKIDGNKARGLAYWTHMTSGPTGYGTVDFFGHYEDEMVKVGDEWLFARRRIYNEAIPEWAAQLKNPVTSPSPAPKVRAPSSATQPAQAPRAN